MLIKKVVIVRDMLTVELRILQKQVTIGIGNKVDDNILKFSSQNRVLTRSHIIEHLIFL